MSFFKKVLVVSDNNLLADRFRAMIAGKKPALSAEFTFRNTVFSNKGNPEDIDLRDPKQVDQVLASYDLVLSLHCKQIFPGKLVENVKCINIVLLRAMHSCRAKLGVGFLYLTRSVELFR